MPPFNLEPYKPIKSKIRRERLVFEKNRYSAPVKVANWEHYELAKPYDNYPYCPENYSLLLSHHNRFGYGPPEFKTTTSEMLQEIYTKAEHYPDSKSRVNLYSFNRDLPLRNPIKEDYCEDPPADEYLTEMQDAYEPPYPCLIQRVAMPKKPFMQNRRIKQEPAKFIDDGYLRKCSILQENNGFRSISFNPATSRYTNEE